LVPLFILRFPNKVIHYGRRKKKKTFDTLLIEDNPGDITLIKEALKEGQNSIKLTVMGDGEEALVFLRKHDKYKNSPRPDIIPLDLNIPQKDGRDVLAEIKSDPELKHIPVLIFTSSEAPQDIINAYDMQAN